MEQHGHHHDAEYRGEHAHHGHGHAHGHGHDHNFSAAYLHVLADAFTSVLAILALAGGWWFGWSWLDPVMGIVGAVLVALWAKNLVIDTGKVLLDREMDHPVVEDVRAAIETGPDHGHVRITDLHVWRIGKAVYACALSVVTHDPNLTAHTLRQRLAVHGEIVHSTIEIHFHPDAARPSAGAPSDQSS